MATSALPRTGLCDQESILREDGREISLLVADEKLSLTYAVRPAGERVTHPHVHRHAEAFYVLQGEVTFEVGAEPETITLGAGGFLAVPPGVAHAFRTTGSGPARGLIVHAVDGGFADFMRGLRDGVEVEWDVAPVPPDGGLPADRDRQPAVVVKLAGGCLQTTAVRPESEGVTVSAGVAPSLSATRCERTLSGEISETSPSIDRR